MIALRTLKHLPLVALILWGLGAGCAQNEARIGDMPAPDAASPGPGFTPPEEDASTSGPSLEVAMCVATECPKPFATCPMRDSTIPHKCATNLSDDSFNCGVCGNECKLDYEHYVHPRCVDGVCKPECVSGFQDCNGLAADGCETIIGSDPDNCGACGKQCPESANGVRGCSSGECCLPPMIWCPSWGMCVDPSTNNSHCGRCDNYCPFQPPDAGPPPPNMKYNCVEGECGHLVCESNQRDLVWNNCNGQIEPDGCEINIAVDTNNCGACGNVCDPDVPCIVRSTGVNFRAECGCHPGETICETGNGKKYCAYLQSDVSNCGICGRECYPNASNSQALRQVVACNGGFCDSECHYGTGDCDEDLRNGCETDLLNDPRNCGTCGNRCSADQPCIGGKCLTVECDAGEVPR